MTLFLICFQQGKGHVIHMSATTVINFTWQENTYSRQVKCAPNLISTEKSWQSVCNYFKPGALKTINIEYLLNFVWMLTMVLCEIQFAARRSAALKFVELICWNVVSAGFCINKRWELIKTRRRSIIIFKNVFHCNFFSNSHSYGYDRNDIYILT